MQKQNECCKPPILADVPGGSSAAAISLTQCPRYHQTACLEHADVSHLISISSRIYLNVPLGAEKAGATANKDVCHCRFASSSRISSPPTAHLASARKLSRKIDCSACATQGRSATCASCGSSEDLAPHCPSSARDTQTQKPNMHNQSLLRLLRVAPAIVHLAA